MNGFELGIDTFGDISIDGDGKVVSQAQSLRNVVEEAVLADELGLDFIGLGEHHRADFAITAPEVVLAAIAGRTSRIHLGSAVTVLSSDDPVRVFERFATLDALSGGRAEVILGRGSFIESFQLFGYSLDDYEVLFEEKVELFVELLKEGPVTWSGTVRAPLDKQEVFPRTESRNLRTWIGVGGTPESVLRAARYNLPLVLAIIGGNPLRFRSLVELFNNANEELGNEARPIALHSHGYVAKTDEQALDELWPHYSAMSAKIGRERGWPPMSYSDFEKAAGPGGALFAGSPETVAAKIVKVAQGLGISRFDMKYSAGTLPHANIMKTIELYGSKVAPLVRKEMGVQS